MSQPISDMVIGLVAQGGATVTPFCRTPGPVAFLYGLSPADNDARFPYHPRTPHAGGFQFDLLSVRPLSPDYADDVLDELGSPRRDERGAAIRTE